MKASFILLLPSPASFSQSPFRWHLAVCRTSSAETAVNSPAKGVLRCAGCTADMRVKADGYDHRVA